MLFDIQKSSYFSTGFVIVFAILSDEGHAERRPVVGKNDPLSVQNQSSLVRKGNLSHPVRF